MAVSLKKGQKLSLEKGMKMARIGLGWNLNKYRGIADFDLDASAFMLRENDRVRRDDDFIFYGQLESLDGSIQHMGDNRVGSDESNENDDEVIQINFEKVPEYVQKIVITVTIYDAEVLRQNFGQVSNAYVRLERINSWDDVNGTEVLRYDLGEDFSIETGVIVCELYRNGSDWKFNAVGQGVQGGLAALCRKYGVNIG